MLDNGDLIQLSEAFIQYTYTKNRPISEGGVERTTSYYLGKIIVTVFAEDGTVKWSKSIDRIQAPRRIRRAEMFIQDGLICVPYMEDESAYLRTYDIKTGAKKSKSLKIEKGFTIIPSLTIRLDDHTFFIVQEKSKKFIVGQIVFE
ncbi:MAG: hypothetical protein AAGD05_06445 [Bacteroidota bacterium]